MNAIEKQLHLQPNRRMSYFLTLLILGLLFIWSLSTLHVDSISNNGTKIAKKYSSRTAAARLDITI